MSKKHIARTIKERWRTERAYEELKGELGLDHYEGRSRSSTERPRRDGSIQGTTRMRAIARRIVAKESSRDSLGVRSAIEPSARPAGSA